MNAQVASIELEQTRLAAEFWRDRFGRDTAKHVARSLEISVPYAKKLLGLERPLRGELRTKAELVWGKRFIALMLKPYGSLATPYSIGAELEILKAKTAELEAEFLRLWPEEKDTV